MYYHENSLFPSLEALYPELPIKKENFPNFYGELRTLNV